LRSAIDDDTQERRRHGQATVDTTARVSVGQSQRLPHTGNDCHTLGELGAPIRAPVRSANRRRSRGQAVMELQGTNVDASVTFTGSK
jgi:hypothetical protein